MVFFYMVMIAFIKNWHYGESEQYTCLVLFEMWIELLSLTEETKLANKAC